ncbi:TetR/AcrR family transcriptional regulator C-terminal domain-containing protein [Merdimonas faecis]|uniref:TetR/AcrR family transcriptional regulator C-terminal domain-containing protein n=1 Tax=Merdimonas faecis TaxID=1653435 RepID=UPI0022E50E4E|nr:TetR/AcrR family transcriptional regulator C-terminal domain-containing protein [Merdimonas faecis]
MSNNMITKDALGKGLKVLLEKKPLSKISVKDITEYCNISRNTFYYHFKDKYELINWIFYTDMLENVNSFNDPSKLTNSFVNVCKCLYANRKFYLACFQYIGQNSLYEYLNEFYYELWRINIDVRYTESGFKLTETELHLMAKMKAHSLVGIISDWVKDGMHDNYMSYFEQVHAVLEFEASGYARLSDQMMLEKQEGQAGKKNEEGKSYLRVC